MNAVVNAHIRLTQDTNPHAFTCLHSVNLIRPFTTKTQTHQEVLQLVVAEDLPAVLWVLQVVLLDCTAHK